MFREAYANRAVNFFQNVLRHGDGQFYQKPFILAPWQHEIIADIFGDVDDAGMRIAREAYIEIPKKNGKSEFAAGIALAGLILDDEPGAQIYAAATAKTQAQNVFRAASKMVSASPLLQQYVRVIPSTGVIVRRDDPHRFFKILSADGDVHDGVNPHIVIVDELHRWKTRKALDLFEILQRGSPTRRQPLLIMITTAGVKDEAPLCWPMHERARQIAEGALPKLPHWRSWIWAAAPTDPWDSEDTWRKANPSLEPAGFMPISAIRRLYEDALQDPTKIAAFKRFQLNIWDQRATRAIPADQWAACGSETRALVDRECFIGVDLSTTTDFTSVSLWFPDKDGTADLVSFSFLPAARAREIELKCGVPLQMWAAAGHLELTPGSSIDYDAIIRRIEWAGECFKVRTIGLDPWNAAGVEKKLIELGYDVVSVRQGVASLSGPSKALLGMVSDGKIRHGGNPLLAWAASCCEADTDGNDNIKFAKPDRNREGKRIDPIAATVNAIYCAQRSTDKTSVYESRGLLKF